MKTFDVLVTRDTTESTTVAVMANDAEEATALAVLEARRNFKLQWTPDDCMGGYPYIADPDEAAQERAPNSPPEETA